MWSVEYLYFISDRPPQRLQQRLCNIFTVRVLQTEQIMQYLPSQLSAPDIYQADFKMGLKVVKEAAQSTKGRNKGQSPSEVKISPVYQSCLQDQI